MGIIFGFGGGDCNIDTGNIFDRIISFPGKTNPKVIILPTAQRDAPESSLDERDYFLSKGCDVDYLRLTDKSLSFERIKEIIESADIIFASGGNLEFLMNTWKETGADKLLKKAFESNTVLCGSSSGMMCWFSQGFDDCGPEGAFMFVDALGLLPYCACPHYESERWNTYDRYANESPYSSFAIENGAALVCIDGNLSVMSGSEGGRAYYFDKDKGYKKEVFGGKPKNEIQS